MSMQGKCWSLGLSDLTQQGENYLEGSRRFGGRGEYPYGTLYSALGMAIHAVPANHGEVLFGAPGTFSWTGTLAAKRFHFQHFSKYLKRILDRKSFYWVICGIIRRWGMMR